MHVIRGLINHDLSGCCQKLHYLRYKKKKKLQNSHRFYLRHYPVFWNDFSPNKSYNYVYNYGSNFTHANLLLVDASWKYILLHPDVANIQ